MNYEEKLKGIMDEFLAKENKTYTDLVSSEDQYYKLMIEGPILLAKIHHDDLGTSKDSFLAQFDQFKDKDDLFSRFSIKVCSEAYDLVDEYLKCN